MKSLLKKKRTKSRRKTRRKTHRKKRRKTRRKTHRKTHRKKRRKKGGSSKVTYVYKQERKEILHLQKLWNKWVIDTDLFDDTEREKLKEMVRVNTPAAARFFTKMDPKLLDDVKDFGKWPSEGRKGKKIFNNPQNLMKYKNVLQWVDTRRGNLRRDESFGAKTSAQSYNAAQGDSISLSQYFKDRKSAKSSEQPWKFQSGHQSVKEADRRQKAEERAATKAAKTAERLQKTKARGRWSGKFQSGHSWDTPPRPTNDQGIVWHLNPML
jgi:hypothetical protein